MENISRIIMGVARASGTDLASSLKQNKFWDKIARQVAHSPLAHTLW